MTTINHSDFTILNVNDNPHPLYVVSRVLTAAGFQVIEAQTGFEAIAKAQTLPDLIILDVKLPDLNGFEVCRRLKADAKTSGITVMHLSAHVTESTDRARGLDAGADAYLTQPIEPSFLVATVRSMLRIKKTEAELRASVARLETERELRERFVMTLSHDLRNPLSAAKFSAQILKMHTGESDERLQLMDKIIGSINRADQMITDLLDVSRIRAGEALPLEITDCDLTKLVCDLTEEMSPIYEQRVLCQVPPTLVTGFWACDALKRVIENLVGNGIKYGAANAAVTIGLLAQERQVTISVHNEGNPLTAEEQKFIFKAYSRSESAQHGPAKGWGLGLTLVKGIAEAHGGMVRVDSGPDRGTTFSVDLPRDCRPLQQPHVV